MFRYACVDGTHRGRYMYDFYSNQQVEQIQIDIFIEIGPLHNKQGPFRFLPGPFRLLQ